MAIPARAPEVRYSGCVDAQGVDPCCLVCLEGSGVSLRQYFLHHPAVHVGEAEVAAGVTVGEFRVVEAE